MTKLSIIVPAYNCENTIEQAVDSIFRQTPKMGFDVTMVDDGSSDASFEVMQRLARKYPNAHALQHENNRGGGAARNTGVAASDGQLLLCVDADDILGEAFLERMTQYWRMHRTDAVCMSTSVKFRGNDPQAVAYVSNFEHSSGLVPFESFLAGPACALSVVFMMTRSAFHRAGTYPTEHSFDTQGMGFRFLAGGMRAAVCPQTVYYHRVGLPNSYYKREESAGRLNWNWFNVFDEFLYLFRKPVREQLLQRDLFDAPGHASPQDLLEMMTGRSDLYVSDYRRLVKLGPPGVAREVASTRDPFWHYWMGNFHRLRGRFARALSHYARALALGFDHRIIYFRMLQAELALSGNTVAAPDAIDELRLYTRPFPLAARPPAQRLYHTMLQGKGTVLVARTLKRACDRIRGRGNS